MLFTKWACVIEALLMLFTKFALCYRGSDHGLHLVGHVFERQCSCSSINAGFVFSNREKILKRSNWLER